MISDTESALLNTLALAQDQLLKFAYAGYPSVPQSRDIDERSVAIEQAFIAPSNSEIGLAEKTLQEVVPVIYFGPDSEADPLLLPELVLLDLVQEVLSGTNFEMEISSSLLIELQWICDSQFFIEQARLERESWPPSILLYEKDSEPFWSAVRRYALLIISEYGYPQADSKVSFQDILNQSGYRIVENCK